MSMTLALALASTVGFGVAVTSPRRATMLLAALLAMVAACARVHGAGADVAALVAAAGVALAFADTQQRGAPIFGLACSAVALLAAPPAPALAVAPLALALAAPVVATLALAAALQGRHVRTPLAVVLALLPFPSAAIAPAHAELSVTFDGAAGAWAMGQGLSFAPSHWPAWADALWSNGPWLLFAIVLVAYARADRRVQVMTTVAVGSALLAAAVAQGLGAMDAPQVLQAAGVGITGDALPLRSSVAMDGSAGGLVLLRLAAIVGLLQAHNSDDLDARQADVPLAAIAAIGALLLLLGATIIAPSWYGAGWMGDPGVASLLLLVLVASVVSVGSRGLSERASGWLHAGLATAGLLLVGGGDLGWRVAGVVFGR